LVRVAVPPLGSVTTTSTAPVVDAAGVSALMLVPDTNVTLLACAVPNRTVAPDTKFVPVIVTVVPPVIGPELGESDAIVNALEA
jgi:hypothetical protein